MSLLRRIACWLGWHTPPRGVRPEMSIAWACRCGAVVPGELGMRRRR